MYTLKVDEGRTQLILHNIIIQGRNLIYVLHMYTLKVDEGRTQLILKNIIIQGRNLIFGDFVTKYPPKK